MSRIARVTSVPTLTVLAVSFSSLAALAVSACGETKDDDGGKMTTPVTTDSSPSSDPTGTGSTDPSGTTSGSTDPTGTTAPTTTGEAPTPPSEPVEPVGKPLGKFDMTLTTTAASMSGVIYGSPKNETVSHEVLVSVGECEVRKPQVFSCIPDCAGGEECNTESKCVAQPTLVDAGELTISGITKKTDPMPSFTLKPLSPTNLKYNVGGFASPPFAPGDAISIVSAGGDLEAFALFAKGIAPLEVDATKPLTFESGKPMEVTWTAGDPELARVILTIDVGHHGGSTAEIYCEVPDTGAYTIPAELVTALAEQGVSGFPAANIERRASSYANVSAGYIELNIGSRAVIDLSIPGIVSCSGAEDCQAGEVCKMPDLVCVAE
jgi:hypothetical protein